MNKRSEWIRWTSEQAQKAAEHRESAGRWAKRGDKLQAALNDQAATQCESLMETSFEDWLGVFG